MIVMRKFLVLPIFAALSLSACTTWGSKMAMGDQHYPSVKTQHVVILFERPARPYKEIGLVSSLGGWFASDGDNYHKMQMAAAQLGADAVIVQGSQPQSQTGLLAVSKDERRCDQIHRLSRLNNTSGRRRLFGSILHIPSLNFPIAPW